MKVARGRQLIHGHEVTGVPGSGLEAWACWVHELLKGSSAQV